MSKPGSPERRFYESKSWKELRRQVLAETEHGLCEICWEPVRPGGPHRRRPVVDHIVPVKVNPQLALERSNLRLVCQSCNLERKGRLAVGKTYRRRAW